MTQPALSLRVIAPPHPALRLLPGIALLVAIAAAAYALRLLPGVAVVSPLMLAILLGVAVRAAIGMPAACVPGVKFGMKRLLRLAIILLGLQLTLQQAASVGATGLAIIVVGTAATFFVIKALGRVLGVSPCLSELIAAGTAICGASAVVATNTVTRASDEDATYAVALVTIFGSIAMAVYPLLPAALGLDAQHYGLWTGASVHEVAQVVAAAFQGGQEAGDAGTVAKLSRVMLLAPMVLALGWVAARRCDKTAGEAKPPLPWFVLGFVLMVGLNSTGLVPAAYLPPIKLGTTILLTVAVAAMGLETEVRALLARGTAPLALGALGSLFISGLTLALIRLAY